MYIQCIPPHLSRNKKASSITIFIRLKYYITFEQTIGMALIPIPMPPSYSNNKKRNFE